MQSTTGSRITVKWQSVGEKKYKIDRIEKIKKEISAQILIVRALEIGISLLDLDEVTVGFLIELLTKKMMMK